MNTLLKFCYGCVVTGFVLAATDRGLVAQQKFVTKDAVLKLTESRDVPSPTSGLIVKSGLKEGAIVKAKQTLVKIDSRLARLDLDKLKREHSMAKQEAATTVELEYTRRSIQVAQAELGRALNSNQRLPGSVAQSEIDQLALVVERAVAEKNKIEFEIQMKKMLIGVRTVEVAMGESRLKDHSILSPIAGMVVEVLKQQGEWVEASQPVARIVQLNRLRTEVKVPAEIALDDLTGAPAVFTPKLESLNDRTFSGEVVFVHPEANPVNGKVKVWVEIRNPDRVLVPGLVGRLEIQREADSSEEGDSALPSEIDVAGLSEPLSHGVHSAPKDAIEDKDE